MGDGDPEPPRPGVKIPKKLDIYGHPWTVQYKWKLLCTEGNHVDGMCDTKKRILWIDRAVPTAERATVFVHELIHGILFELKINQTSIHSDLEEILVTGIEEYFMEKFHLRWKG